MRHSANSKSGHPKPGKRSPTAGPRRLRKIKGFDFGLDTWQEPVPFDPARELGPYPARRSAGKAVRRRVPREALGQWQAPADRPDPVSVVLASNEGRIPELIPLRMARMAGSPFGFLRGSAAMMAWDLAHMPTTGMPVVLDGDAHLSNFGLFGSPQREVLFDLSDFDETTVGPWDWDLKRLVASVAVVARENHYPGGKRRRAVLDCVRAYRATTARLQDMGVMDVWYQHAFPGAKHSLVQWELKSHSIFQEAARHAEKNTSLRMLPRVARRGKNGLWKFVADPPKLTLVDKATVAAVEASLSEYTKTLAPERRFMMNRYRVGDVAHRVVGVGSVGTRCYLVMLFGAGDTDPLFLQVKEALRPALTNDTTALSSNANPEGRRVVLGQRFLQASSDVLLGWTTIAGRPFYVRQMRDMKGSIELQGLPWPAFHSYVWSCGALLARAHARTGDVAEIAGYCGNSDVLDNALADFAEAYADQTAQDHEALVQAIKKKRVKAVRLKSKKRGKVFEEQS